MVPEEIRNVERPRNTIVVDHKGNGKHRYAVIERIGCKRVNGKNIPINGSTVGYIYEGQFIKAEKPSATLSSTAIDILDWADAKLLHTLGKSLFDELEEEYAQCDAEKIYAMALLKVLYPGIVYGSMSEKYSLSALKEELGDVPLSKNTVSAFINTLGRNYSRIVSFMRKRVEKVKGDTLALDGTLKTDNSTVNSLSHYSRKTRIKGTRDISVLYAYDIKTLEPVCAKAYPGNVLDIVSYSDFLLENEIKEGVIMGDKAFQRKSAEKAFAGNEKLHYLNPLKRDDKRISNNRMTEYKGMLSIRDKDILFSKSRLPHSFLYGFYDRSKAAKEEKDYFLHHKDEEYDEVEMVKQKSRFGTIVFESDLDLEPEDVYRMYDNRWLIETTFRYYKNVLEFDDTKVQDDYSVYGNEFICFLSTVLTMRLIKKFEETGLSEKKTFGDIMGELRCAKQIILPDGSRKFARTTLETEETLCILGLKAREDGTSGPVQKRKRGRPRKV